MNIEHLSTIYQQGICHGLYKDMLCINFYQCSFKDIVYARQFEELPFDKTSSLRVIYKDKQLCTKQQNFYLVWLLNSKWDIFLSTLITTKTHRTFQTRSRHVKPELIPAAATYMRPIQSTFEHRWERWSTRSIPLQNLCPPIPHSRFPPHQVILFFLVSVVNLAHVLTSKH